MFLGIKPRFKWYIILRFLIVISIISSGIAVLIRGIHFNFLPLIIIILMTFLMNVIFFIILKKKYCNSKHIFVQLIFDNLLIFAIIYYTGGHDSVFNTLYFLNIITGSYFLFTKGGMVFAIMSSVSYAILLLGEHFGFLISPYFYEIQEIIPIYTLIIRIYVNTLAYFLIAAISGFLSERFQKDIDTLKQYRLRLKDIINNIDAGIIIISSNGYIMDFNKEILNIFPEITINKKLKEVKRLPNDILNNTSLQYKLDDKYFDIKIQKIKHKEIYENYILIFNDITNIKEYENKLLEKERLSAIGELAASIAHEIRNPLSSIKGALKNIEQEIPDEFKKHPMMEISFKEIERLNNLINEFLFFTKTSNVHINKVYILNLLQKIITMFNIDYIKLIGFSEETIIFCDIDKIKQVFINLIKNSIQAIKDLDKPEIIIEYKNNNDWDILIIKDNGKGISEKVQKKMFQPFNSDKPDGTGLGLAIVYKIIVDEHKGKLDYITNKNGTSFIIQLRRHYE